MSRAGLLILFLILSAIGLSAQTALDARSEHRSAYERLIVLYQERENTHLSIQNPHRSYLFEQAHTQILRDSALAVDWTPLLREEDDFRALEGSTSYEQLRNWIQRSERPALWNTFFTNPNYLFSLNRPEFYLRFDPILHGGIGNGMFNNERGAYVRGGIDQKLFFEAQVLESQVLFPDYVDEFTRRFRAIPGNGFFKSYNSSLLGISGGRDFNNSKGRISWKFTPHISGTVGYDQNFIGHGYRSLILSDFSNNYFFGRLDTRVWKLHYTNIWGKLAAQSHVDIPGDRLIPTKWFAHHYLSLKLFPNLNIGLFETVVFGRENGAFDIHYLVPVIFYRSIEGSLGSPDNMMLGLDYRWDLFHRLSLYGQLTLDEFRASELFVERRGWWANKYAIQLGAKYFDPLGWKGWTAQAEMNLVRPFTYIHRDSLRSFSHYNMPMAHPMGANFVEYLFRLTYQYQSPWKFELAYFFIQQGRSEEENVGWNITRTTDSRQRDFGFQLLEGEVHNISIFRAQLNYEIYPDLDVYARGIFRSYRPGSEPLRSESYLSLGLTYNFQLRNYDF